MAGRPLRVNIAFMVHERCLHCIPCGKNGHGSKICRIPWKKIREQHKQKEDKNKTHEPTQFVIAHCISSINEELFKTSFICFLDRCLVAWYWCNLPHEFSERLILKIEWKCLWWSTLCRWIQSQSYKIWHHQTQTSLSCRGTSSLLCTFNSKAIPFTCLMKKLK